MMRRSLINTAWVMAAVSIILFSITCIGCGDDGDSGSSRPEVVTDTQKLEPEDIQLPPPTPPPGRAPDPVDQLTPIDDSLQVQLETILAAYDINYQFGVTAELASDRYAGRKTGSAGARAAAEFIAQEYARFGLAPWKEIGLDGYRHHFVEGGHEDDNVIGVLPGSDPSGRIVILSAHYDHLGVNINGDVFNGADDNAAGVGAVLEAAAILNALGWRPVNTIVFCAFSGEEQGQHGARALGKLITDGGIASRVEVINVDGIGATGGSYFGVWDQDAAIASPLVYTFSQAGAYVGVNVVNEGSDIGSDAKPFDLEFGIPAVTVDWDWGSNPSINHPNYHTIHDDAESIHKPTLARATQVILVAMWLRASGNDQ